MNVSKSIARLIPRALVKTSTRTWLSQVCMLVVTVPVMFVMTLLHLYIVAIVVGVLFLVVWKASVCAALSIQDEKTAELRGICIEATADLGANKTAEIDVSRFDQLVVNHVIHGLDAQWVALYNEATKVIEIHHRMDDHMLPF